MPQRKKADIWQWICVLVCAAMLCGAFFYSGEAMAQAVAPDPYSTSEDQQYQGDLFCPYKYDGLTGRVVHCIQSIIVTAAQNFLDTFLQYYEAAILAAMIISVTIYGAMFAMGTVSRPTAQTFFFVFKLAGVGFFVFSFDYMLEWTFDIMEGLLHIVTNYVTVSSLSACSDNGHLTQFFEYPRQQVTVWDKVDCLFITLLGIGVAQSTAFGLIMVLSPLVFTGGIGLIIVIMAMFFILTLLVAVIRAIKIYLVSVITVAFLICVSPLIIPLLLFSHTRPIFDKWLKYVANYMLIPVFLFAYLSMIVAAYDAILFKGPSSLYYAIANRASQEPDFTFRDWVEVGASGRVARYDDGSVVYNGAEPSLLSGELVGRDVPGVDAQSLMQYKEICANGTEAERELAGEICDKTIAEIDTMIDCSINPIVADGVSYNDLTQIEDCKDIQGRNYYGFLRNEEIFHFAIAPNIETDQDARADENEGCGWNPVCHISEGAKWLAGKAFDLVKTAIGALMQVTGALLSLIGDLVKGIGQMVEGGCRLVQVPGAICDTAGGAFMISGSVIHAGGSFVNFSGRVLQNGLMAELGELFQGWFDAQTLDVHKIAAYRCKADGDASGPTDEAYITTCPGPEDIIMDVLYVMITAAVVAYLMLKWLNYIPSLGREMVGAARVEASLPGEARFQKSVGKMQHGLERMVEKQRMKRKGLG